MPHELVHVDDAELLAALAASRSRPGSQGLPEEHFTGERLRELSESRNLLPVIPFVGDDDDDVGADVDFLEACINLEEPQSIDENGVMSDTAFIMMAGEERDLRFKYNVGVPNAHAFGVFFFESYGHSITLRNPIVLMQPSVVITPQVPVADPTGFYDQYGMLSVTIPDDADDYTTYYGALVIYQQGAKLRSEI